MNFSSERAASRFKDMKQITQDLAIEMDQWSQKEHGIELTLTETVTTHEEDRLLFRKSDTHRTGRAFDVRIQDPMTGKILLTEEFISLFCGYFRKKYPHLGAVLDNQSRLIVYKPHGTGPHLHIQIKRSAT